MCGIAAFSRGPGSTINARELAHALLGQIESRGSHAAGFSYYGADGSFGIYKQPKPGSQLSLAELPRDAQTVILHTRYATQGAVEDNRNNHPVLSTDNNIALVHNGVISNDHQLRAALGIEKRHGEVDSLVIPSTIAQHGLKGLTQLQGYAAIAWLDASEQGLLNILKLKSSPVNYTHLADGTFVMASTAPLLEMALLNIDYEYGGVFELAEGRGLVVDTGFIMDHYKGPQMSYSHQAWQRHSNATSGGHGTTTTTSKGSEDTPLPRVHIPSRDSEVDGGYADVDGYLEDLEKWREKREKDDANTAAMALARIDRNEDGEWDYSDLDDRALSPADDEYWERDWESFVKRMEEEDDKYRTEREEDVSAFINEGFYIIDHDDDLTHYPTLEDLEARLRWLAKMTKSDMDIYQGTEDSMRWVNSVQDIGNIGPAGSLVSWVDDMADMDEFESPAVRNLNPIREGISFLERMKGA